MEARNCEGLKSVLVQGPSLQVLALRECASLKAIDIESLRLRHLWIDRDKKLATFMVKAADLEVLSCEETPLTDTMLYNFLLENPKLKQLNLGNCPNLTKGARKIALTFLNPHPLSLNLSNDQINAEGVKALAANTTLTSLDLQWNRIGKGVKALSANSTLTSLNLNGGWIGDRGAKILAVNTRGGPQISDSVLSYSS